MADERPSDRRPAHKTPCTVRALTADTGEQSRSACAPSKHTTTRKRLSTPHEPQASKNESNGLTRHIERTNKCSEKRSTLNNRDEHTLTSQTTPTPAARKHRESNITAKPGASTDCSLRYQQVQEPTQPNHQPHDVRTQGETRAQRQERENKSNQRISETDITARKNHNDGSTSQRLGTEDTNMDNAKREEEGRRKQHEEHGKRIQRHDNKLTSSSYFTTEPLGNHRNNCGRRPTEHANGSPAQQRKQQENDTEHPSTNHGTIGKLHAQESGNKPTNTDEPPETNLSPCHAHNAVHDSKRPKAPTTNTGGEETEVHIGHGNNEDCSTPKNSSDNIVSPAPPTATPEHTHGQIDHLGRPTSNANGSRGSTQTQAEQAQANHLQRHLSAMEWTGIQHR
ncbi:unnamed protein product [Agarophyton chilense]